MNTEGRLQRLSTQQGSGQSNVRVLRRDQAGRAEESSPSDLLRGRRLDRSLLGLLRRGRLLTAVRRVTRRRLLAQPLEVDRLGRLDRQLDATLDVFARDRR